MSCLQIGLRPTRAGSATKGNVPCSDEPHLHTGQHCSWPTTRGGMSEATVVAVSKKPQRTIAAFDEEIEPILVAVLAAVPA